MAKETEALTEERLWQILKEIAWQKDLNPMNDLRSAVVIAQVELRRKAAQDA